MPTSFHVAPRYCSTCRPRFAPIARESAEVSPVDSPTQTAIIRNSSGTVSPTAATASSPRRAAYTVSTIVMAARIQNDTTSGAAIRSTVVGGLEVIG